MLAVRQKTSGSWLDPQSSGELGYKLGLRLIERTKGRKGLFLTLTYDRSKFVDALDCYRLASEHQHVALFMRKLSRALKRSFVGKWICKLEFQQGGWSHFHLLLLDVDFIDHELLTRCWGRGFTYVKPLNKKNTMYLTKYVAKGGKLPAWLYGEAPRSVKIVRVSRGFWGPSAPKFDESDYRKHGPARAARLNAWVPIAVKLAGPRRIVVRMCATGRALRGQKTSRPVGATFSAPWDFAKFLSWCNAAGAEYRGRCKGWLLIHCPLAESAMLYGDDRFGGVPRKWLGESGDAFEHRRIAQEPHEAQNASPRSGDALYLSGTGKPDAVMIGGVPHPRWLADWYAEAAQEASDESCRHDAWSREAAASVC